MNRQPAKGSRLPIWRDGFPWCREMLLRDIHGDLRLRCGRWVAPVPAFEDYDPRTCCRDWPHHLPRKRDGLPVPRGLMCEPELADPHADPQDGERG